MLPFDPLKKHQRGQKVAFGRNGLTEGLKFFILVKYFGKMTAYILLTRMHF